MAKKVKKKVAAPSRSRRTKSKLPDLVSGQFCIAGQLADGNGTVILCEDGQNWSPLPPNPYVFPSKTHAAAYVDGMFPTVKGRFSALEPKKLSEFYGQHFQIKTEEGEKVVTSLVPKTSAVSFKEAVVTIRKDHQKIIDDLYSEVRGLTTDFKREISEREKAYKERLKAFNDAIKSHEKELKGFLSRMNKLG